VRVTAAGARSFVLNYRAAGRERRFTIGTFPDWSALKAVREARKLRQAIDRGEDPQAAKEAASAPAATTKTIAELLDEHVSRYLEKNGLRTADHIKSTFKRLVTPRIGKLGIYEIRRSDVVAMLDKIEDENGPVMADRTLAYVRKAFNWYAARDDRFVPPIVKGMARTKPSDRKRKRILTDEEIREVWAALDALPKAPACYPRYVHALLLTAMRRDQVAKMTWAEINGDEWIIPDKRNNKTKLDHLVPLSDLALKIIGTKAKDAGPYVFSNDSGKKPFGGYSKAKKLLDAKLAETRAKDGREPIPRWTLHDLRRTARTLMSSEVGSDIAERVVGHVISGVRGVYDRYEYRDEKRDALDKLARRVERILNPPAGNVEHLDGRRRA
jgi:integrase